MRKRKKGKKYANKEYFHLLASIDENKTHAVDSLSQLDPKLRKDFRKQDVESVHTFLEPLLPGYMSDPSEGPLTDNEAEGEQPHKYRVKICENNLCNEARIMTPILSDLIDKTWERQLIEDSPTRVPKKLKRELIASTNSLIDELWCEMEERIQKEEYKVIRNTRSKRSWTKNAVLSSAMKLNVPDEVISSATKRMRGQY